MNNSQRSKRKKSKGGDASRRDRKNKTGGMEKSQRKEQEKKKKGKKNEQSERGKRKGKVSCTASRDTTGTGGTTGSVPDIGLLIDGEGRSKMERKVKANKKEKEQWSGEEPAKKMMASGTFNPVSIKKEFLHIQDKRKTRLASCKLYQKNLMCVRARDYPIKDDKLIKLTSGDFICAAKIVIPDFDKSTGKLFPIRQENTFFCHGSIRVITRKIQQQSWAVTHYNLEVHHDGCANPLYTTLVHIQNWKQKEGLDDIGDLVSTTEWLLKANMNILFLSGMGLGRSGTMLALFTVMHSVSKGQQVSLKKTVEILRQQRCGLVETAPQYATLYRAIALWFKNKSQDEEIQKKVNEFAPCVQ
ncbi:hypothetical protein CAEBREN_11092 [Caenorhabditis brenneri]|uniref:Tyrosine-protein phosphatase domain-containing protein n=1 Tax=Caenorhabditis brenneri TaxID=135651 RepID=G0MK81_CAEBE|nr:hypothetical protein CAEBREN_11092 [Caenorhabditis brenneri]